MTNPAHLQKGFSLIDTLLGVGIFIVITVSLIQFTLTTLHAADNLSQQIRAQNIAREGIEILENLRGTNTISHVIWTTPPANHPVRALRELMKFDGLARNNEICVTVEPTPAPVTQDSLPWKVTPISCPAGGATSFENNTRIYDGTINTTSTPALFNHAGIGMETGMHRYIRVRFAKNSPSLQNFWNTFKDTRGEPRPDDDVIEVESVVSWKNSGRPQEIRLQKVLADFYE